MGKNEETLGKGEGKVVREYGGRKDGGMRLTLLLGYMYDCTYGAMLHHVQRNKKLCCNQNAFCSHIFSF